MQIGEINFEYVVEQEVHLMLKASKGADLFETRVDNTADRQPAAELLTASAADDWPARPDLRAAIDVFQSGGEFEFRVAGLFFRILVSGAAMRLEVGQPGYVGIANRTKNYVETAVTAGELASLAEFLAT